MTRREVDVVVRAGRQLRQSGAQPIPTPEGRRIRSTGDRPQEVGLVAQSDDEKLRPEPPVLGPGQPLERLVHDPPAPVVVPLLHHQLGRGGGDRGYDGRLVGLPQRSSRLP